jgi:antitoxin VapB
MHLALNTPSTAPKQYAKIFTTGRSQAVRLPKAFRFEGSEVLVERQGDAVILRPKAQSKEAFWEQFEKSFEGFEGLALVEREPGLLREPVKFE